MESAG
jgi:hypothetical protein